MIDVGALKLHVVEAGSASGSPLILLHGFPEFWWGWRHQIGPLADAGYRIIVPDLRGYGGSERGAGTSDYAMDALAADVIGLAKALDLDRFDLVGHDWGGIIAWAVAARRPENLRKLVIMSAPHADTMIDQVMRHPMQLLRSAYVGLFQLPVVSEALLSASDFAALRHALTATARPGTFKPEEIERYVETWRRPGRLTAMLNYYRALQHRAAALGRIKVPTRILWGAKDSALGSHLAYAAAEMCDVAEVKVHGKATHWLHHEEAEWVNSEIMEFCRP